MCICLYAKYPLFLSHFHQTWLFSTDFRKILKFHKNPPSVSRVVPCGRTHRRTGVTKLTVSRRKRQLAAINVATVLIRIFGYRMAVSLTRPFVFTGPVLCICHGCELYSAGFFENWYLLSWSSDSPHLRTSNHFVRKGFTHDPTPSQLNLVYTPTYLS